MPSGQEAWCSYETITYGERHPRAQVSPELKVGYTGPGLGTLPLGGLNTLPVHCERFEGCSQRHIWVHTWGDREGEEALTGGGDYGAGIRDYNAQS